MSKTILEVEVYSDDSSVSQIADLLLKIFIPLLALLVMIAWLFGDQFISRSLLMEGLFLTAFGMVALGRFLRPIAEEYDKQGTRIVGVASLKITETSAVILDTEIPLQDIRKIRLRLPHKVPRTSILWHNRIIIVTDEYTYRFRVQVKSRRHAEAIGRSAHQLRKYVSVDYKK